MLGPIEAAVSKCKNHPSINAIRGNMSNIDSLNFDFEYAPIDQTLKEHRKLDKKNHLK